MLQRGIYLAPSAFEAGFTSLAHSEDDIDATLQAFMDAGYSTEAAIEVVAGISVMTFTSFYNHINDTEVDFPTIPKL